jgi:hypothetical protein
LNAGIGSHSHGHQTFRSVFASSLVESEHPVREAQPEGAHTSETPEASVVVGGPAQNLLVGAVAEWRIGRHLAVAELEVARLRHVEGDGAATGHDPLALAIAEGRVLGVTARAPVVNLATVQVDVRREKTSIGGKRGRSVLTLLIGT